MVMLSTLDVPGKNPRWGSGSGRTLEPSESKKTEGSKEATRFPAKWHNWIQNLNSQWLRKIMGLQLMNWRGEQATHPTLIFDLWSSIFHPDKGFWLVAGDNTTPYWSSDGHTFTQSNATGVTSYRFAGIDNSYYILGEEATDNIKYSVDAGQTSWSTVLSATIGGSGNLTAIYTKYPDANFAMISRGQPAAIRIAAQSTGIGGAWTAPTTPPTGIAAGAIGAAIIYIGSANTWLLLVTDQGAGQNSKLFKSTDDGDVWSQVTGMNQFLTGSWGAGYMAYSRDSGRLVVCGSIVTSGQEEYVAYSDDLGDTWTEATIDKKGIAKNIALHMVYYCGGESWVAMPRAYDEDDSNTLLISVDNAETWQVTDFHGAEFAGSKVLTTLVSDGRKIMCLGNDSFIGYSRTV